MKDRFATNAITMLLAGCASARGYFSCSDCKSESPRDMPADASFREDPTKKSTFATVLGWGAGLLGPVAFVLGFVVGTQMIGGDAWVRGVPIATRVSTSSSSSF